MTTASELLRAPRFGVKDFKTHLSERIKSRRAMVLLDRGEPKKVIIEYNELIEMIELIDDLQDKELVQLIHEGSVAARRGDPGISVKDSFAKIKAARRR